MSITIKEKLHWKERIEARIDRRIKEIEASEPKHVWEEINRQADQKTLEELELTELMNDAQLFEEQIDELRRKQRDNWTQCLAKVRGVDVSRVDPPTYATNEVTQTIAARRKINEQQLRAEHPKGRMIESLRNEKEELLDTVWLATSPAQIKELWSSVLARLECEVTPLQKQALAMKPLNISSTDEYVIPASKPPASAGGSFLYSINHESKDKYQITFAQVRLTSQAFCSRLLIS